MDEPIKLRQTFDDKNLPVESARIREWTQAQGLAATIEFLKSRGIGKQESWKFVHLYLAESFPEFSAAWAGRSDSM